MNATYVFDQNPYVIDDFDFSGPLPPPPPPPAPPPPPPVPSPPPSVKNPSLRDTLFPGDDFYRTVMGKEFKETTDLLSKKNHKQAMFILRHMQKTLEDKARNGPGKESKEEEEDDERATAAAIFVSEGIRRAVKMSLRATTKLSQSREKGTYEKQLFMRGFRRLVASACMIGDGREVRPAVNRIQNASVR
jgi:hypothetical protein